MASHKEAILSLKKVSYATKERQVLENVYFNLYRGEIHALVGEHHAGKSAIVKLICGEFQPDSGTFLLYNHLISKMTPELARKHKISIINQESRQIPNLTVMENVIIGEIDKEILDRDFLNKAIRRCKEIFKNLDIKMDPSKPLLTYPASERQMIEFARMVYQDPDIIILDDVSGRFTNKELALIFEYIQMKKKLGKSVIFIDSNLDKILEMADRVSTMHHGYYQGTESVEDMDRFKLLKLAHQFAFPSDKEISEDTNLLLSSSESDNIFSDLPGGVIILDVDNKLSSLNKMAEKILKRPKEDLLGSSVKKLLPTDDLDISLELLEAIELRVTREWSKVILNKNQVIKLKCQPFFSQQSTFRGTIVLIEDLTTDLSIKEYLVRAEKISSIAELAAGVSHEINNPLGIISNYLQVLKYKKLDKDVKEKLDKISIQMTRINDITSSLLSFSGIKTAIDNNFDLIALLEEITLLLSYKINNKKITINTAELPSLFLMKGDENRLRQVFVNFLSNSIEAVASEGEIKISLTPSHEKNFVLITFWDDGYGIPRNIQKEIFTPFYTTKMTKKNAGLGLSICQHIIEAHNGIITFDSIPGEYTEFRIQLPIQ